MRQRTDAARRVAVVYNPAKVDVDELKASVSKAAAEAGYGEPRWFETSLEDAGHAVTRQALETGAHLVITAGGDGTVRAAAEVLRGTDVSMGLVPAGTGNLLARNLKIPLNSIDRAVAIAFGDKQRVIDVGVAVARTPGSEPVEHVFLVMAGLGLDAAMISNTNSVLKKKVGWLAYVDAGMRALPKVKKVRIRYRIDTGEEHRAHVSTILVGNCGSLPGGIELLPDAAIDDGQLDVAVMQPRSVFGWLLIWRRVMFENKVLRQSALGRSYIRFIGAKRTRTVTYLRGAAVSLRVDEPQPFEIDGDPCGDVTEIQFHADASSLSVKVG